jgi:hypothetical protein
VGACKMGDSVDGVGLRLYRPFGIVGFLPHVARQQGGEQPEQDRDGGEVRGDQARALADGLG